MAITMEQATAVAGIGVALLTYSRTRAAERRLRRAEFIRNYTTDFYSSSDITRLFMEIDYDRFVYNEELLGSRRELALIHLIDYFNALGYNWKRRILSLDDIVPTTLGYAVLRVWENPSVRRYLDLIRKSDEKRYLTATGFRYFEELAIEVALLCGRIEPSSRISDLVISTRLPRSVPTFLFMRFPRAARAWRALLRPSRRQNAARGERQGTR